VMSDALVERTAGGHLRAVMSAQHKDLLRNYLDDPGLEFYHHDIRPLGLFEPALRIDRIQPMTGAVKRGDPLKVFADMFLTLPMRYKMRLDQRWGGHYCHDPEIHEGKTVAAMIDSLLTVPIRRPIEVSLVAGVGIFVLSGNNRIGGSVLAGRTTIPARVCVFLWTGSRAYPGDEVARAEWLTAAGIGDDDCAG
jgi:hypothetical protein